MRTCVPSEMRRLLVCSRVRSITHERGVAVSTKLIQPNTGQAALLHLWTRSSASNVLAFQGLLFRFLSEEKSRTDFTVSPIQPQDPPFASSWNVSPGMACKRMFASGQDNASQGRPTRCIATTKHLLKHLMPQTQAPTMCISVWSVLFLHHEATVSSSPVWTTSLDGVRPYRWSAVAPRP